MKIAIPVWNDKVSPLFDTSEHLLIAQTGADKSFEKEIINISSLNLFQRIDLLKKLKIDRLLCGGITEPILKNVRHRKIDVTAFLCGDVEGILAAIAQGKDLLKLFAMPGKTRNGENE